MTDRNEDIAKARESSIREDLCDRLIPETIKNGFNAIGLTYQQVAQILAPKLGVKENTLVGYFTNMKRGIASMYLPDPSKPKRDVDWLYRLGAFFDSLQIDEGEEVITKLKEYYGNDFTYPLVVNEAPNSSQSRDYLINHVGNLNDRDVTRIETLVKKMLEKEN
tara:strand:- start:4556 stop:5047 length:492 start_codon:yes stop_codon:yes gene_type:complete